MLALAIALGGRTLNKFKLKLSSKIHGDIKSVQQTLQLYLRLYFKFTDRYAKWLTENLHLLNEGSIKLMEDLDRDAYHLVSYSVITSLTKVAEVSYYRRLIKGLPKHSQQTRLSILETGIRKSIECGKIIPLREFDKILGFVQQNDLSVKRESEFLKDDPLHEWLDLIKAKKSHEQYDSKEDFYSALQQIMDLNEDFVHLEDDCTEDRHSILRAFNEINFPINNTQVAIAMCLANNMESKPRQLCVFGAGLGKSRIAAAIALHALKHTTS